MKILVDARELGGRRTGVGRYLLELLKRWAARPDRASREIVLVAPELSTDARCLGFAMRETGGASDGTLWEQRRLPQIVATESPDVLFSPAYTAPLATTVPVVVTIHDISFTAHPEWFSLREGLRRRFLTKASARRAAAIVTVSDFSAEEISTAYAVARSKIRVIRHGVTHIQRPAPVPREPLVLFVGSIFNRRHVPELMAAVRQLRPHVRGLRLVVAGENRTRPRQNLAAEALRLKITSAVELADFVDEDTLAALYARARVLVFVSDYEGFGLTPLEALAAGVPPVVADTKVAHETCGDAALYVRPGDVDALAAAIRALLVDDRTRTRLLEAAPAVLGRYSWERAADETLRVIEQAARR